MNIDLKELAQFLVKAKTKTYASGGVVRLGMDKSKNLEYKEGKYIYRDRYFGSEKFAGEEVVWFKGKPIWTMNYCGKIMKITVDSERIFNFLKKALLQVSHDQPFRGPSLIKEGDFEYVNSSSGDITWFKGTEKILYCGEVAYQAEYAGQVIKE